MIYLAGRAWSSLCALITIVNGRLFFPLQSLIPHATVTTPRCCTVVCLQHGGSNCCRQNEVTVTPCFVGNNRKDGSIKVGAESYLGRTVTCLSHRWLWISWQGDAVFFCIIDIVYPIVDKHLSRVTDLGYNVHQTLVIILFYLFIYLLLETSYT